MKPKQTIGPVVKRGLCTGCGTCAGLCPRGALTMSVSRGGHVPQRDTSRCNRCGLCYEVCPGHSVDFEGFNTALFGDIPEDIALGRHLGCYVGHATDEDIRYSSASGGLVSSLLVFALQEGLIDGALVTRMREDDPLKPEPFIARTREEILAAARSKYCPVAANTALREILASDDRVAVVGLPCHIQGIRKAERQIPRLAGQIRYRISLACSLNFSFRGTVRFLESLGITPDRVAGFEYRGRGWPGAGLIRLKDGTERTIPYPQCYRQLRPYSLWRCTLCSDMLGELSDLTCGDAWLPERAREKPAHCGMGLEPMNHRQDADATKAHGQDARATSRTPSEIARTDRMGSSFVISRTSEAEELLEYAASKEAVELSELEPRDLLASQGHALFKKRKLPARLRLCRLAGRSVPQYRQKLLPPTRRDYIQSLKFYAARYVLTGRHPFLCLFFRSVREQSRSAPQSQSAPAETISLR